MGKVVELRNNGVTIAKAMAIILMVLGHSGCPEEVNNFLGIMRMPLFFMMSGYCFKAKYIDDGKKYLARRVTGVYIPYLKWGLFFLLMHNVFCYIGLYEVGVSGTTFYSLSEMFHRALTIVLCMSPEEELIGGFWFLHDLFWGSLIFYFSLKFLRKSYIVIPLLLSITMLLSYYDWHLSYFVYPRTVLASAFITSGYAFKSRNYPFHRSWIFIISAFVIILAVSLQWHSNFLEFTWTDVPLYTILAVMGSLMLFGLGEHLDRMCSTLGSYPTKFCYRCLSRIRSALIYIGGKTFNVLTWHMLSFKLVSLLIIYIYSLSWSSMADFTTIAEYSSRGWFLLYFVIGVTIPILGSLCFDRIKSKLRHEK